MAQISYTLEGMLVDGELLSWTDLDRRRNEIRLQDHVVVKFLWVIRRCNDAYSYYVMPRKKWELLKSSIIGTEFTFYEFNGKHGDIYGTLTEDEVTVIENMDKVLDHFDHHGFYHGSVDFIGAYEDKLMDDEVENPDYLREYYPETYESRYGDIPEV